MNVPGKKVRITSGRVKRTRRTSCSSQGPCPQFASDCRTFCEAVSLPPRNQTFVIPSVARALRIRSEEHTSELQSHSDLVCRLLLEKKKKNTSHSQHSI